MKNVSVGVALGALVGALGVAVHGGFVSFPLAGLFIGALLVASGAWYVVDRVGITGWFSYVVVVFIVTFGLLFVPYSDDVVVSIVPWMSLVWCVGAVVAALVPGVRVLRGKKS